MSVWVLFCSAYDTYVLLSPFCIFWICCRPSLTWQFISLSRTALTFLQNRISYPLIACGQLKYLPVIRLRCGRSYSATQTSSIPCIRLWFCFVRNWQKDSIWMSLTDSKCTIICRLRFVITAAPCCMVYSDRGSNVKVLYLLAFHILLQKKCKWFIQG